MLAARPIALGLNFARHLARPRLSSRLAQAGLLVGLAAPATLAVVPAAELLERAHFSLTAFLGLVVTLLAWQSATGKARAVRGWIVGAFLVWGVLNALTNVNHMLPLPLSPDVLLVGLAAFAAGAYHADLAGRMPWREQLAVYLDAAVVTATVSAALIAWLGDRAVVEPRVGSALFYAIVFVAILSATLVLDLAIRAELRPRGAYVLLGGIGLVAVGFITRALQDVATSEHAGAGLIVSGGGLLVAYGAATWRAIVDDNPRYVTIAGRLRQVLPLTAVVLTPLLLLGAAPARAETVTLVTHGLALFALVGVVVRQSLLLQEREGMLGRLAAARGAAERRTQQIAGLEAVGRLLAEFGPTDKILTQVIEVIFERFGYAQVAVYLADGPVLRLGAQRGYAQLFPTLDGTQGVVGRVMRTRRPALVRDVTMDPDYLMADPDIRSEICAPLLDDGEFLGILDVESSSVDPLDETDLAAVVAVADQLAGAMALALRRQRLLLEHIFTSALLDTVAAVIVVTDPRGRVVRFNPACAEVSGYTMEELREHDTFLFLVPPEQREAVEIVVGEVQHAGLTNNAENDWVRKDGTRRRISWANRPVPGADGRVEFVLATGIDITERKQLEDQLAHRALHDPLTALPNRALLMDRLEQALKRRRSTAVGVLFIDLDGFKLINDTLGHQAGDDVLRRVAHQLSAVLRPEDTAARVGGDEFAAVLDGLHRPAEALAVAERVRQAIRDLRMEVRGTPVSVNASIGVATSAPGLGDAGDLLRRADIAMYSAKSGGGERCAVYRHSMHTSMVERRDIERLLLAAIEQEALVLHYQPIVALKGRRLEGAEALLRWQHPTRGLIGPGDFLGAAETTGLIVPIGAHVLREACKQLARWQAEDNGTAARWVSVNASPRQFADPGLVEHVRAALAEAAIEPDRLVIEITENLMIDINETTVTALNQLRELGVRFAIDDFGSGYSSLSYLRQLPIELLKLDGSFIVGVDVEPQQFAFVAALVSMADTLGLRVLAEGIETDTQYRALRRIGCELGQGNFLGSPAAADAGTWPETAELPRRSEAAPVEHRRAAVLSPIERWAATGR